MVRAKRGPGLSNSNTGNIADIKEDSERVFCMPHGEFEQISGIATEHATSYANMCVNIDKFLNFLNDPKNTNIAKAFLAQPGINRFFSTNNQDHQGAIAKADAMEKKAAQLAIDKNKTKAKKAKEVLDKVKKDIPELENKANTEAEAVATKTLQAAQKKVKVAEKSLVNANKSLKTKSEAKTKTDEAVTTLKANPKAKKTTVEEADEEADRANEAIEEAVAEVTLATVNLEKAQTQATTAKAALTKIKTHGSLDIIKAREELYSTCFDQPKNQWLICQPCNLQKEKYKSNLEDWCESTEAFKGQFLDEIRAVGGIKTGIIFDYKPLAKLAPDDLLPLDDGYSIFIGEGVGLGDYTSDWYFTHRSRHLEQIKALRNDVETPIKDLANNTMALENSGNTVGARRQRKLTDSQIDAASALARSSSLLKHGSDTDSDSKNARERNQQTYKDHHKSLHSKKHNLKMIKYSLCKNFSAHTAAIEMFLADDGDIFHKAKLYENYIPSDDIKKLRTKIEVLLGNSTVSSWPELKMEIERGILTSEEKINQEKQRADVAAQNAEREKQRAENIAQKYAELKAKLGILDDDDDDEEITNTKKVSSSNTPTLPSSSSSSSSFHSKQNKDSNDNSSFDSGNDGDMAIENSHSQNESHARVKRTRSEATELNRSNTNSTMKGYHLSRSKQVSEIKPNTLQGNDLGNASKRHKENHG